MADYIDRDMLIAEGWHMQRTTRSMTSIAIETKKPTDFPAADVVEVVRCKDCRDCMEFTPEYKEKSGHYGTCRRLLIPMLDDNDARIKADDYCSYGERKEGEG